MLNQIKRKKMSDAMNLVTVVVGARGTGKTHTSKLLINSYAEGNVNSKILILDLLDHPDYRHIPEIEPTYLKYWTANNGVYRCYRFPRGVDGSPDQLLFEAMRKNDNGIHTFNNGLLVVEDTIRFFKKGIVPDFCLNYIVDSKQINVDLIFIFHAFGLIPPDIWRFTSRLVIHKTKERWDFVKGRVSAAGQIEREFLEVQNSVNRYEMRTVILD
jgi:hypothetical protein